MTTEYKIIKFDEATGQVLLRVGSLAPIPVDLPIDQNGNLPAGEALTQYLSGFIPTWYFERQQRLANGVANASAVIAMVEPEPIPEPIEEEVASAVRAERDRVLATCDWTQLPDTALSETGKAAWATYRQALRAVPEQAGFPLSVQWPISPDAEPR